MLLNAFENFPDSHRLISRISFAISSEIFSYYTLLYAAVCRCMKAETTAWTKWWKPVYKCTKTSSASTSPGRGYTLWNNTRNLAIVNRRLVSGSAPVGYCTTVQANWRFSTNI